MPGDSHTAVTDELYKEAFVDTLYYQEEQTYDAQEHFPLFLMGNSLTTLIRAKQSGSGHLSEMKELKHDTYKVKMITEPSETYFFNGMTELEQQAVFNVAEMFNKEVTGLRMDDLLRDEALNNKIQPLAVFEAGDDQWVAIAEGIKVPIYCFAYGIELIQFYFENTTETLDHNILDHSLVARKHAQYIADNIADEARLSTHEFSHPERVFERLARHEKLVTVKYATDRIDQVANMPVGMSQAEIYVLQ